MMRSRVFLFCLLAFVILFQLGVILFQGRKLKEAELTTDHVEIEFNEVQRAYSIKGDKGYVFSLIFNDDGALNNFSVNDKNDVRLGVTMGGDIVNFMLQDPIRRIQTLQYYNLTKDLLLYRTETLGNFSRNSQLFNDGTFQQIRFNNIKKEYELEFPVNGTWKDVFPLVDNEEK